MRRVAKLSAVAIAIVVAGGGTMAAYAQWTVPSKPISFKVKSVDMPRGVRPSVAKNGTDAVVSWSPQEIDPGTPMQTYIVKRRNADDDSLAAAFPPTAAVTVTEKNVAAGKWYWTITPTFALWTGAEGKASEKLKVQGPPPADAVAANTLVSAPTTAATGAAKAPVRTTSVVDAPKETMKPVQPPAAPTPVPTPATSEPTTRGPAESTPSAADPNTPAGTGATSN
jgi:hypothetical protein